MIKKIFELFLKVDKPILGRWGVKTCNDISANINSIYQNRDHCGDTICKTPKKASEYPINTSQRYCQTNIKNIKDKQT